MQKQILKVKSSPQSMVTDFEALAARVRRYVGRTYDPTLGPVDPETNKHVGGWPLKNEPDEIPYRPEYVQAVKEGDLIAADKATADFCGVPFQVDKATKK